MNQYSFSINMKIIKWIKYTVHSIGKKTNGNVTIKGGNGLMRKERKMKVSDVNAWIKLTQNAMQLLVVASTFTFMHLADTVTYIALKVYTLSVHAFPRNRTHDFGTADAHCTGNSCCHSSRCSVRESGFEWEQNCGKQINEVLFECLQQFI